jgi:group I intron endonuclease
MNDSFYKLGGIYKITHIASSRMYIGSAINFVKRWSDHRTKLRKNIHDNKRLQNFWNKYGEDSFKFDIVEVIENPVKETLEVREQYWINYYNSADRNVGFNLRKIAQSNLGFKMSKETKLKMRLAKLGKKQSLEHIVNAAASHRGKSRTFEQRKTFQVAGLKVWKNKNRRLKQSKTLKNYFKTHKMSAATIEKCREAAFKRWNRISKMEN